MNEELFIKIQNVICRPEGTFEFEYDSPDLFNEEIRGGIILEIPSGQHLFRLERDDNLNLYFYHSSPGTGTRVAIIDLKMVTKSKKVVITFSWSPKEMNFFIASPASMPISAKEIPSEKQFRIGMDGSVHQIGDNGIEIMGVNIYQGNQPILQPTAIDAWNETINAIEILSTGESTTGYIYETILTNSILTILVTGYEAYTKKRFLELEQEGIAPNIEQIISKFYSKKEIEVGIKQILQEKAAEKEISLLQSIIQDGKVSFQEYEKCKIAYNKGYGIKFGELNFTNNILEDIQKFIKYRHKIIHVSASLSILNQEKMSTESPVFPNKKLATKAIVCFKEFIEKLHNTTLNLR